MCWTRATQILCVSLVFFGTATAVHAQRQSASPTPAANLPADWSGSVTYTGTYEGSIDTPGPRMRKLTLNEALRSASRANSEQIGGPFTLELTFQGRAVSGRAIATGRIRGGTVSGTRDGDRCRLFIGQTLLEGKCTAQGFSGNGSSQGTARRTQSFRVDAPASRIVDKQQEAVRREAEATELAARRANEQAERDRLAAVEVARIASLPRASAGQCALLDRTVQQDSGAWSFNRYDSGSMSNVRLSSTQGSTTVLRGEYTYNGGSKGWVEAEVSRGSVSCLRYHDASSRCTEPRSAIESSASTSTPPVKLRSDLPNAQCFKTTIENAPTYKYSEVHDPVLGRKEERTLIGSGGFHKQNICNRPVKYIVECGAGRGYVIVDQGVVAPGDSYYEARRSAGCRSRAE